MPDILLSAVILIGSLFLLIRGSNWFVDSAERIGLSLGISPFIIGVTIVAFGTSLPELASSVAAVLEGRSEIVASIAIGSNITNIFLVLGIIAALGTVNMTDYDVTDIDMPLLLGSAALLWFCMADLEISLFEAFLFLIALSVFLLNSVAGNVKDPNKVNPKFSWKDVGLLVLGGILVKYGAEFTIVAIGDLATGFGIQSTSLAQTLVALGTSLPEVAVSVTAARKGKSGIAVGNVLGSNIFNTYAVIGIPSFFGKLTILPETLTFTLPLMIVATILFAFVTIGQRITRWEGYMLLIFYIYFINESFSIL